jgi:hypothetical protein
MTRKPEQIINLSPGDKLTVLVSSQGREKKVTEEKTDQEPASVNELRNLIRRYSEEIVYKTLGQEYDDDVSLTISIKNEIMPLIDNLRENNLLTREFITQLTRRIFSESSFQFSQEQIKSISEGFADYVLSLS